VPGQDVGLLHDGQVRLEGRDGVPDVLGHRLLVLLRQVDEGLEVFPERPDLAPVDQDGVDARAFGLELPGLRRVLPGVGVCENGFELF